MKKTLEEILRVRHPHQLLTRANAYELGWPLVWIFRVLDSPASTKWKNVSQQ